MLTVEQGDRQRLMPHVIVGLRGAKWQVPGLSGLLRYLGHRVVMLYMACPRRVRYHAGLSPVVIICLLADRDTGGFRRVAPGR
ncbi:hypothetical protein Xekk_04473 [Xenorhabdus sp. KK7.4]|nr:hypothetical protein Xekk_04473 [Xenorhabdus sp. KK7.4]